MADLPKLVVPDDWPPVLAASAAFARLHEVSELEYFDTLPGSPEGLIERIRDAEVVINIRSPPDSRRRCFNTAPACGADRTGPSGSMATTQRAP